MFVIQQLAITGKFVPDNGEHITYRDPSVATVEMLKRYERDGARRQVIDYASGRPVADTTDGATLADITGRALPYVPRQFVP